MLCVHVGVQHVKRGERQDEDVHMWRAGWGTLTGIDLLRTTCSSNDKDDDEHRENRPWESAKAQTENRARKPFCHCMKNRARMKRVTKYCIYCLYIVFHVRHWGLRSEHAG